MSAELAHISKKEICEMLVVLLNESDTEITPETAFKDLTGWDSMGTLLLMAELDERFGITLKDDQLKRLGAVTDLIDIIKGHGNLAD